MKVSQLIELPFLEEMQIIAGQTGINREIHTVNMMDAPDIIPYLKSNEMLVTTAYHLKDNPQSLAELVQSMVHQNCAALGIKTQRYLKEIPEEVITLANDLHFPIIELPSKLSLGEIVNQTLRAILDKKTDELAYAIEIHKQFTHLIMSGKGIEKLLDHLSHMIQLSTALLDPYLKPLSHIASNSPISSLMNTLTTNKTHIPACKDSHVSFSIIDNKQTYTIFPVYMNMDKYAFLTIAGDIGKHEHLTTLMIEQATNVLSFALMKENALKQFNRSIRNDFIHHFLEGDFSSSEEILNRAKEFSLPFDRKYICITGKLDDKEVVGSYAKFQQRVDAIYEFIEEEIFHSRTSIHFFTRGDQCIFLYETTDMSTDALPLIELVLQELQTKILFHFQCTISFGVSSMCQNFSQVASAYQEANNALLEGRLNKSKQYINFYRMKDTMELLRSLPREDLENFYAHALQGFTNENKEEEQTLLQTLSVFLETHCQISETAKRLYVHRNTVVYRLEKCEELLGKSLKDSETTLQIRLALRAKTILKA